MIRTNRSNSSVKLLAVARPGDVLRTLLQSLESLNDYDFTVCSTLYDVMEQLQSVGRERPVFLIGRPAMLANHSFLSLCKKLGRVRLIGWISEFENPADKAFGMTAEAGLIMVSSLKQLDQVLEALHQSVVRQTIGETETKPSGSSKLNRQDYRLSHEELDALLGAG